MNVKEPHLMEGILILYSDQPSMMSPAFIRDARDSDDISNLLCHSNVYLLVSRKRMCVVPSSLVVHSHRQYVTGRAIVYSENGEKEYFDFGLTIESTSPLKTVSVEHEYDSNLAFLFLNGETRNVPLSSLAPKFDLNISRLPDLKVEYIGKAWGKDGSRSALDRLKSHEQLNEVLSSVNNKSPFREVYVLFYEYQYQKRFLGSSPEGPEPNTNHEAEHWNNITNSEIDREDRILLSEAALINYFKPRFNKTFKNRFPHKDQKVLRRLLELDFGGLAVEINSANLYSRLISDEIQQAPMPELEPFNHVARFDLHQDSDRRSFMSYVLNS